MQKQIIRGALLGALLTACAGQSQVDPAEPVRSAVTVTLAANQSQAFERTKAAFVAEGLSLAQADPAGGLVVSTPVIPEPGAMFRGEYQYRAVILAQGDSSRVVLTATGRSADQGAATQAMSGVRSEGTAQPLTSACRPNSQCGRAWARVEKLAAAITATR